MGHFIGLATSYNENFKSRKVSWIVQKYASHFAGNYQLSAPHRKKIQIYDILWSNL